MKAFRVRKGTNGYVIKDNKIKHYVTRKDNVFDDGQERCMDSAIKHNRDIVAWCKNMEELGFTIDTINTVLRYVSMGFDTYMREGMLLLVRSSDVEVM